MRNIIFERRIWQNKFKCAIRPLPCLSICRSLRVVCLCVHLSVCVCLSAYPAVCWSVDDYFLSSSLFLRLNVSRYLPSATRNPLLQKLKLLIRWSWSHSGSDDWTACSCEREEVGLGGAMLDCQEIMSSKFSRRLTRIWLATSSLELNNLLKQNKGRLVLPHSIASNHQRLKQNFNTKKVCQIRQHI